MVLQSNGYGVIQCVPVCVCTSLGDQERAEPGDSDTATRLYTVVSTSKD
jgi:hypothetical protein